MDVVFARCAGIAVHKRLVVVCRLTVDATGQRLAQTRTFGTTTSDTNSASALVIPTSLRAAAWRGKK